MDSRAPTFTTIRLLCVKSCLALTLLPIFASAQGNEQRSADGPLPPTGIDASADPNTRIMQFESYLTSIGNVPGRNFRKEILLEALEGLQRLNKPPVDLRGKFVMTCLDFFSVRSWKESVKIAMEPLFASCYSQPNTPLLFEMDAFNAFIAKVESEHPTSLEEMRSYRTPVSTPSRTLTLAMGQSRSTYESLAMPYREAYREKQQREAAEQQIALERAAKEARMAKMENPDILGIGLNTTREQFMAIRAQNRDVWSCEKNARLRTETCTAKIHNEDCVVLRSVAGDVLDCQIIPDPAASVSAELRKVSTIVGQPVSKIVVNYFDRNVESIEFIMARPKGDQDRTDYLGALMQKFGEPEKHGAWEGRDSRLVLGRSGGGRQSPAVFALSRPSVTAAKQALVDSLKRQEQEVEQRRQEALRRNI